LNYVDIGSVPGIQLIRGGGLKVYEFDLEVGGEYGSILGA
jgi:hypothetical protein